MAQIDVRRLYADGDILLGSDLDAFLDDVETFLNITKINDDNIQDNAITASSKLADATVTTAKLASNAVTTAKITDANITAVKLATDSVETAKIKDENVTAAKLATDAVETAKIKDANVTIAKLASDVLTPLQKGNSVEFTSSNTWTVPAGVKQVIVEGVGGGGGGAGQDNGGGTGGPGCLKQIKVFNVTPGASITVTIGAGGAGGGTQVAGGAGGNTSFDGVVVGYGAPATTIDRYWASDGWYVVKGNGYVKDNLGAYFTRGGVGSYIEGTNSLAGQSSGVYAGGAASTHGGGGASSYGAGGASGASASATAYGAGGGGQGGNGASGYLKIYY